MEPLPRLTAAQTAARLGVKPQTLYAYVSRGLLGRQRTAAGSTFDPMEVEGFARRRRPAARVAAEAAAAPTGSAAGIPLMVLDTDIAAVAEDRLYFRGRRAADLARLPFETAAAWLWGAAPGPHDAEPEASPAAVTAARAAVSALPPMAGPLDRIAVAITAFAAADPLRNVVAPAELLRVGALLLRGVPLALAPAAVPGHASPAQALWAALSAAAQPPSAPEAAVLDTALVLLMDHDLAVSTLAARVAASARASGYAVVGAALGALDSPLHGRASHGAAELLARTADGWSADAALAAAIGPSGRPGIPGFGHAMYHGIDDRARILFDRLAALPEAGRVLEAVAAVSTVVERRAGLFPNIDLALAALEIAAGFRPGSGAAVFALGRTAGWIAHAAAEYGETPMRLRPRGRYLGPAVD